MTASYPLPVLLTCRGRLCIRAVFDPLTGTWWLMARGARRTMSWLLRRRWARVGGEIEVKPPRPIRSLGNLKRFYRFHRDLWHLRALFPLSIGRRP